MLGSLKVKEVKSMERERSTRIIAIAALIVGVVGLTIGFAFTASQLTIKSSAEVNPVDDFSVLFSSSESSLATDDITPTMAPTGTAATGTDATIDNSNPKAPVIQNLHSVFTDPGQSATYNFYAWNPNDYTAYLKALTFASNAPTCTAKVAGDQGSVDAACAGISIIRIFGTQISDQITSLATITGHSLASKTSEPITVVIEYAANAKKASGDFDVEFGDITLTYDTLDS